MKGFIEVTDYAFDQRVLLSVQSICLVKEGRDGLAVINFEMAKTGRECNSYMAISSIITVEPYDEVKARIVKAVQE